MDYETSYQDLEKILDELREDNKTIPILVEGDKDVIALRRLNMTGVIIKMNRGVSLTDFCDDLARTYKSVILLLDWDKKGGFLCAHIIKKLEGRVTCNTLYREQIAKRSVTRKVEGLPSWLNTLREKINFN
jgi:5S rRNA maturation endonuclease (ribonuclease M5)